MPTEVEIKINIPDKSVISRIQQEEYVTRFVRDGFHVEEMHTIFYDTPDWDLCREQFMLRMRSSGQTGCLSLKHGCVSKGGSPGLCIRRKWVCTTTEIETAIESLLNAGAPERLKELTRGKPLIERARADFTRTSALLHMPEGLRVELAMDEGEISVGELRAPVLEMELEVLFGNIESLRPFCDGLSERYGLSPALTTKYEKAFALAHDA
ncbi:MAG: inorganic triphosphatase [Oscillospiraceae bacterium]|jgi:triphosphatase